WRRAPKRCFRVRHTIRHFVEQNRKSGFGELRAYVLRYDRFPRRLRQYAAIFGLATADALYQKIEGVEHAVDIEWGGLDGYEREVGYAEASQGRLRAEARSVDDDPVSFSSETLRCSPNLIGRVLDNRHPAKHLLSGG